MPNHWARAVIVRRQETPFPQEMVVSRLTAISHTTVPQAVRRALRVGPGDSIGYDIDGEKVTLRRLARLSDDPFVNNVATFTEWASEADRAYDVLANR